MCCVIATLLLAVDSNIVESKTHLPLATGLRDNREDAQLAEQLAEALRNPLVHYRDVATVPCPANGLAIRLSTKKGE